MATNTGNAHTIGLKSDGTVVSMGWNEYGQCNVSDWCDIVAVATGCTHTIGHQSDGTVESVGGNEYGKCDVSGWCCIQILGDQIFGKKGTFPITNNFV